MIQSTEAPQSRTVNRVLNGCYRALAGRLQQAVDGREEALQSVGVTSTELGSGVTAAALNLAMSEAIDFDRRVLLVDAHSRQPTLSAIFGLSTASGVSDVLTGAATVEESIHPTGVAAGLEIVPSGRPYPKPRSADAAERMQELFRTADSRFDRVIVDLPPVKLGSGCLGWVHRLDGVVLILEAERVKAASARAASDLLKNAGARLLGVVLNKVPAQSGDLRRRPR